jgi:hypothetical protein
MYNAIEYTAKQPETFSERLALLMSFSEKQESFPYGKEPVKGETVVYDWRYEPVKNA